METRGRQIIREYDKKIGETGDLKLAEEANRKLCEMAKEETAKALTNVLHTACGKMKDGYNLADN